MPQKISSSRSYGTKISDLNWTRQHQKHDKIIHFMCSFQAACSKMYWIKYLSHLVALWLILHFPIWFIEGCHIDWKLNLHFTVLDIWHSAIKAQFTPGPFVWSTSTAEQKAQFLHPKFHPGRCLPGWHWVSKTTPTFEVSSAASDVNLLQLKRAHSNMLPRQRALKPNCNVFSC